MAKKRNHAQNQHVTIEVCSSLLRLVILRGNLNTGKVSIESQEVRWREKATSLLSEVGRQELATAFKHLSNEHKLAGADVTLALNGAFCVTRVVTGEASEVKREMAELEQRSQLYLSLGPGHKALAGSMRNIDARHQHALLTVSNQRTLDTLIFASSAAGWHLARIEPSLFALSRTLGQMKLDRAEPVMVLNLDEKGVEAGIYFDGMLLLDYRPGGRSVHQNLAEIIGLHLPRLQRFCSRYFRFITGELNKVLVCGEDQYVQPVLADFSHQDNLTVAPLSLDNLATEWDFAGEVTNSTYAPALGSALGSILAATNRELEQAGPNLLEHLRQQMTTPLSIAARKFVWPVAAVAAALLVTIGLNIHQQRVVNELKSQVAEFDTVRNRAQSLRTSLVQAETKGKQLDRLSHQLEQPNWSKLWTIIGGCLPPNVWVDSFKLEAGEHFTIIGTCYSENGVFEFVRWLKQVPEFREVALTSTRPVHFESKPAINFQLDCPLVNSAVSEGGKE